jgi:hypothetical protein
LFSVTVEACCYYRWGLLSLMYKGPDQVDRLSQSSLTMAGRSTHLEEALHPILLRNNTNRNRDLERGYSIECRLGWRAI